MFVKGGKAMAVFAVLTITESQYNTTERRVCCRLSLIFRQSAVEMLTVFRPFFRVLVHVI
jgi:hypothetical protein